MSSKLKRDDSRSTGSVAVFVEDSSPESVVVAPASASFTNAEGTSGAGNGLEITKDGGLTAITYGVRYPIGQFGNAGIYGYGKNDLYNLRDAINALIGEEV